jgi:hypothetical protein
MGELARACPSAKRQSVVLREKRMPRFGPFVWTVLILDCLPCLLRLFAGGEELIGRHIADYFTAHFGFIFGIAVFGLCGNILILCRKRIGIFLALASVILDLVSASCDLWSQRNLPWFDWPASYALMVGFEIARACWLMVYAIAVRIAVRKMSVGNGVPAIAT